MANLRDASQIDSERRGQGIRLVGDVAAAHLLGLLRPWDSPACRAAARLGETSSSCALGVIRQSVLRLEAARWGRSNHIEANVGGGHRSVPLYRNS